MKKIKAEQVDDDINLVMLAQEYSDDDTARKLLEEIRWPNGKPICPHCKFDEAYKIVPKATSKAPARKGMYCCSACRKQFTVTVGTIMEDSHVPIGKWLMAIFIMCSSKKSISALQLSRMLKLTYKTAWFLNHRIRHGISPKAGEDKLNGIVEVDETFVGGKGDHSTRPARQVPVVALIEQGGNVRTRIVSSVNAKNLGAVINELVDKRATLSTDEHAGYKQPAKEFKAHYSVNHSKNEFTIRNADGTMYGTNHCESFFSLLKRGVYGSWHHVSREHLPKYTNEFAFRWNTRFQTDGKRMETAIAMIEGKRLTYRQAV